jgi:non-ribosomal peptide synthetase component F
MDDGDFRCACQSLIVPKNIVEGMRELGRQEGCTLPMTSFAALNALVHELTGQEDIRVGTPLAARNRPEVEAMVGCFRKRMILRTDLSGRPTFRALLARVRDVSIGAYLHLNVSPETVFPERGVDHPAHWSRVPINFNFIERLGSSLELPGVAISSIERRQVYNWVDLDLFVFQAGNGLRVEFRSRRSLFTVATIKQFLEAYGFLLRRVVSESNQRLAGIRVGNEPVTHL